MRTSAAQGLDEAGITPAVERLIEANAAVKVLGIHPVTLRELANNKKIPALKIGRVWRFWASALDAWVDGQLQWDRHSQSPKEQKA